nr:hypothetical protein GTC16762_26630 [Pigmentibacter ruber]
MDATVDFKKYADLKNQFVYKTLNHNTYYYLNNKVVATTSSAESEDFYSLSLFRPENVDSTKTQYESVTINPVRGAKLDYVPGTSEANDKFYYFTQYESYFNASGIKNKLEVKESALTANSDDRQTNTHHYNYNTDHSTFIDKSAPAGSLLPTQLSN